MTVVAGSGLVNNRPVLCYAQDFSVAGGSVGEAEAELLVNLLRQSRRTRSPVVGFMESAGARLQEGVAALDAYGQIFHENVASSGVVPQISVITGTAAGGGCYSPALTDFVVMCQGSSMFLTGPKVVREALNDAVSPEALGGSRVHERNGVCHFVAGDEGQAIGIARELLSYLPRSAGEVPPRTAPHRPRQDPPGSKVPLAPRQVYDMREPIGSLVDDGRLLEFAPRWARNLVTGFARLDGHVVGIVANQPRVLGGILDVEASRKGTQFVSMCDRFGIPLLVLVDTPGFMPGMKQESAGVIHHGAELVRAFSAAKVPRVSVILRKAYGGAFIAMNSKSLGADLVVAWPRAEVGIMGARSAARILHRGQLIGSTDDDARLGALAAEYAQVHLSPWRAARRGLIDAVVSPNETRQAVVAALFSNHRSISARGGRSS